MWFIKFHIIFSLFCLITAEGFFHCCKETIKNNGWYNEENKTKPKLRNKLKLFLYFFVPFLNIIFVIVVFVLIGYKKENFEKLIKDKK